MRDLEVCHTQPTTVYATAVATIGRRGCNSLWGAACVAEWSVRFSSIRKSRESKWGNFDVVRRPRCFIKTDRSNRTRRRGSKPAPTEMISTAFTVVHINNADTISCIQIRQDESAGSFGDLKILITILFFARERGFIQLMHLDLQTQPRIVLIISRMLSSIW